MESKLDNVLWGIFGTVIAFIVFAILVGASYIAFMTLKLVFMSMFC